MKIYLNAILSLFLLALINVSCAKGKVNPKEAIIGEWQGKGEDGNENKWTFTKDGKLKFSLNNSDDGSISEGTYSWINDYAILASIEVENGLGNKFNMPININLEKIDENNLQILWTLNFMGEQKQENIKLSKVN
tara:strand:+ start:584 stop:988 length:405 start_codon:yes stop_codon:yes gene_type:complete